MAKSEANTFPCRAERSHKLRGLAMTQLRLCKRDWFNQSSFTARLKVVFSSLLTIRSDLW